MSLKIAHLKKQQHLPLANELIKYWNRQNFDNRDPVATSAPTQMVVNGLIIALKE